MIAFDPKKHDGEIMNFMPERKGDCRNCDGFGFKFRINLRMHACGVCKGTGINKKLKRNKITP